VWFDSYRTFEVAVDRLAADAGLRSALGDAGNRYTARYYRWPSIIGRYADFLETVIDRGHRSAIRSARLEIPVGGTEYVRKG
jgi:glycosyltransferase involved in cell wall biosynthesis